MKPPAKKGPPLLWIGLGIGALVVVGVIVAVVSRRPEPTPPPPVADRPKPLPPPPAPVKPPPEPVDRGPESPPDRVRWLERQQAKSPQDFKRWHAEWSALLPKVPGTPHEQRVRDELERLEGAAHKEFRARFRPVRERINELTESRRTREALQVLRDWRMPEGLDLKGEIQADLDKEIARLEKIAALDEAVAAYTAAFKAGKDPGDPKTVFAEYLKSPDIGIRMPAEYALRSLIVLNVTRTLRLTMEARRTAAEARIEGLRRDLVAEEDGRKRRIEAWERKLKEATKTAPLAAKTFGMSGSLFFRILGFDGHNLTYGNASVELKAPLAELPPAAFGQILELAVDPADADGVIEAGRMAVRAGSLDSADRLFRAAIRARPAFEPLAPSVDKLRRTVGTLGGKVQVIGDKISLAYAFDHPGEAEDFKPVTKVQSELRQGSLRLKRGDGVFLADIGNVEFTGRLRIKLRTAGVEGNAAHAFGCRWEVTPGEADLFLVILLPSAIRIVISEGGETPKVLHEGPLQGKVDDLELDLNGPRTELKGAGKSFWTGTVTPNAAVRVIVGGVAINDAPAAEVGYASIDLEGRGAPEWIRTIRSERRALVEAELSKEVKVLAKAGAPKGPRARAFGRAIETPLPLEEGLAEAFTDDARKAIGAWRAQLRNFQKIRRRGESAHQALQVEQALDAVVRDAAWLPLGYYYRAEWKYVNGDLAGALADLDESLARHENFVEAHVAKADLYGLMRKYEEAGRSIDAALAAVPDLASPRLTRALLHYYGDRRDAALQELGLAMRLAPEDLNLRLEALRLERILAGPRWPAEIPIDTDHYIVRAELATGTPKESAASKERVERAARTLEITRRWFEELVPGEGQRTRKPIVYFFQSPESYYVHADLAHGDRLEHSLGVFFPKYQQLLFFLGGSEEETLGTMIHESFHEYLASIAGSVPPWLNEGFAEYASSARIEGDRVVSAGAMLPDRAATLRRALKRGFKGIPFPEIMNETQSQFMSFDPALQYAQAWSMVHFLVHFDGGKYKPAFEAYIKALIERKPRRTLIETAFKGLDLATLQREWLEYIRSW